MTSPRIGLCGLLGAGNLGNDGSLEAMLAYLRAEHPDAIVDCMSTRPDQVTARYGIPAAQLRWYQKDHEPVPLVKFVKVPLAMIIDGFRTASWVRRHDVVIVPGMGVFEATVPIRAWHTPYSMFLLSASGRLSGTKVAFVCVGADFIRKRLTRRVTIAAARLAYYRSYRDTYSRDAMRQMDFDTSSDAVYPDLVFSVLASHGAPVAARSVGVGVMDYHGGDDDRPRATEIHTSYVEKMKHFVLWLVDNGRPVRLFATDVHDEPVVWDVIADVRARRPGLAPSQVVAEPVSSLDELMQRLASVDTVVATRYHNLLCALKLAKPALSVGYGAKSDALMEEMGLAEFCQSARSLDVDRLIRQFTELESRSGQLRQTLLERSAAKTQLLQHQFATLSAVLFPAAKQIKAADAHNAARTDAHLWSTRGVDMKDPASRDPASLMRLLQPNIQYYGMDIAIHDPAPNLIETDFLEVPIRFDVKRFDIVIAQGHSHRSRSFRIRRKPAGPEIRRNIESGGGVLLHLFAMLCTWVPRSRRWQARPAEQAEDRAVSPARR